MKIFLKKEQPTNLADQIFLLNQPTKNPEKLGEKLTPRDYLENGFQALKEVKSEMARAWYRTEKIYYIDMGEHGDFWLYELRVGRYLRKEKLCCRVMFDRETRRCTLSVLIRKPDKHSKPDDLLLHEDVTGLKAKDIKELLEDAIGKWLVMEKLVDDSPAQKMRQADIALEKLEKQMKKQMKNKRYEVLLTEHYLSRSDLRRKLVLSSSTRGRKLKFIVRCSEEDIRVFLQIEYNGQRVGKDIKWEPPFDTDVDITGLKSHEVLSILTAVVEYWETKSISRVWPIKVTDRIVNRQASGSDMPEPKYK